MKKILTLLLAVCMTVSLFGAVIYAEAINNEDGVFASVPQAPAADPKNYTVYVSNSGADENAGARTSPVATLSRAYALIKDNGTTEDANICVLDDIYLESKQIHRYDEYTAGTVYIFGVAGDDGEYPYLDFNYTSGWSEFRMSSDTVLYDICLRNGESGQKAVVLSAARYELTLGRNVYCERASGVNFHITSTVWENSASATGDCRGYDSANARLTAASKINIYDGNINKIYVGWRGAHTKGVSVTGDSEVNIYGGSVVEIYDTDTQTDLMDGRVDINVYGLDSSCKVFAKETGEGSSHLTYTRGLSITLGGSSWASKTVISGVSAAYCGVQNTVAADGSYSVRFVGVVDSLEYEEIGFVIEASNGKTYEIPCTKLYTSIVGDGRDYTAAELGGKYIFAAALRNIPVLEDALYFKATPYTVSNGVKYVSDGENLCYDGGEYASVDKTDIKVLSLNLLNNDTHGTEGNLIEDRMPRVIDFIISETPDSFGVQECDIPAVFGNMRAALNNGIAQSGYVCAQEEQWNGETYAFKNFIWYNSNTTDSVASGQYWLSETPDVPSKGFGAQHYISMGWAVLENIDTGFKYIHVNTHLTAEDNSELRLKEAEVLLENINDLKQKYGVENVVITGDFNEESTVENGVYSVLTESYGDALNQADSAYYSRTFHAFTVASTSNVIDHCFFAIDDSVTNVDCYRAVEKYDGSFLSDHSALIVDISIYSKKEGA